MTHRDILRPSITALRKVLLGVMRNAPLAETFRNIAVDIGRTFEVKCGNVHPDKRRRDALVLDLTGDIHPHCGAHRPDSDTRSMGARCRLPAIAILASSSFITSRKSNSVPAVLSGWRRYCAGTIPSVVGVRIAIDDFGTGYSSLSYLADYPISRMKIAQELVFGVDTGSRSATVVRAGHSQKFLLSMGCESGQGFYFSRPVNADRATELLRAGRISPVRGSLRLIGTTAA